MNAATALAPELVKAPTIITKHLFHVVCNPEGATQRISYCGMKFGPGRLTLWNPNSASPETCVMCLEARKSTGCPICGTKIF
jgi:hypothetical protein